MALRNLLAALLLSAAVTALSSFEDENIILPVTDRFASIEPGILHAIGNTRHAFRFARFAHRYGKSYRSVEEIRRRFEIFVENLQLIQSSNRKGLKHTLGINRFADMTWEEFRASRLGAAQNCSATLKGNHKITDTALPETKDWREEGIVSAVKDQGHCGSCWTFSTTGALEAAYTQLTGKEISLSEQQLVDCASAFNNFGCHGGLPSQAFEYIKYNGGLDTEGTYPYQGVNGICNFKTENVGVKVIDSVNITLGSEEELKHAVGLVQPVSVAFEVVTGFRFYKKGVYTSDTCGKSPMDVNHAVLAVGYGVVDGIPYWLLKNSWGGDWGDNGYFKMELGKNLCGGSAVTPAQMRGISAKTVVETMTLQQVKKALDEAETQPQSQKGWLFLREWRTERDRISLAVAGALKIASTSSNTDTDLEGDVVFVDQARGGERILRSRLF